ncbi:MAG: universal stress protein [Actinomycetota bacterium]
MADVLPTPAPVIVGVDGSPPSRVALAWAATHIDLFGSFLPLTTYRVDALGAGTGLARYYATYLELLRDDAWRRLAESVEGLDAAGRSGAGQVHAGPPGPTLLRAVESGGHELLVVGCRGRSAVAEALLGSVGSHCATHATVPVIVVPAGADTAKPIEHVVVGVDGSDNAQAALRWTLDHVGPAATVTAIGCWSALPEAAADARAVTGQEDEARHQITATVEAVLGRLGPERAEGPTVEIDVRYGDPRQVLRVASEDADLLVVRARGHRGVPYLLLGSTASSLLHHPLAPTAVIPDR